MLDVTNVLITFIITVFKLNYHHILEGILTAMGFLTTAMDPTASAQCFSCGGEAMGFLQHGFLQILQAYLP